MLGQKNNLPDMRRVVRNLAIDRLQNGVRFAANHHSARHIFRFERVYRAEDTSPAFVPPAHYVSPRGRATHLKLAIAETVGLFAVAGEEVGEARPHIACQVLYKNGNGIRLRIKRQEKVVIPKL